MSERPIQSVGLWWDDYTPAVEGQVVRDIIALQSQGPQKMQIMAICRDDSADRTLDALGVKRGVTHALASLWIAYKTGPEEVEVPEHAETVIVRDLFVDRKENLLDPTPRPGYFMAPQGRVKGPSSIYTKPMPTHSGPTDPMVILLWS